MTRAAFPGRAKETPPKAAVSRVNKYSVIYKLLYIYIFIHTYLCVCNVTSITFRIRNPRWTTSESIASIYFSNPYNMLFLSSNRQKKIPPQQNSRQSENYVCARKMCGTYICSFFICFWDTRRAMPRYLMRFLKFRLMEIDVFSQRNYSAVKKFHKKKLHKFMW